VAVSVAADEPSVADLQAELNEHLTLTLKQKLQLDELKTQLNEQKAQIEELRELVLRGGGWGPPAPSTVGAQGAPSTTVKFGVDGTGAGRALSEASSSMAVRAWQTHEFPDGHTCPNLDTNRPKMLLPVKSGGSLTWSQSPSDLPADANVSLVAVEKNWSTSEVQSFPNPFKIIHGADCTAAPTLELPLATSVPRLLGSGANQLVHREAWNPSVQGDWYGFVYQSWTTFIAKTITTTLDSTLIFANYQISGNIGGYIICVLSVDGVSQAGTRSFFGDEANYHYAFVSATWAGTVDGAGSHSFQVNCRTQGGMTSSIASDWGTQALTILKLGDGASSVDETTASHI
jgi:hypothetical protein